MRLTKDIIAILIITLALIYGLLIFITHEKGKQLPPPVKKEVKIKRKYGFAVDSFMVYDGKIHYRQTLASILSEFNVSRKMINRLNDIPKDSFDITRIRAGNHYTAFCRKDSNQTLQYFVYEHTPIDYFVLDFRDSVNVYRSKKEIKKVRKSISDTIRTSLWMTLKEGGINPTLAIELSEMYAWVIDFFMLDKHDHFTVIFDENYVDSSSIGIGKIHAAVFNHLGNDFYAFPFKQDGRISYYDLEGNSLRREFLKAPLRYSRISSGFSYSRLHPVLKVRRPHTGIDYAAPSGTPVHSVGDGIVVAAAYGRGNGRYIKIRHNSVYTTAYLHLRAFGKGIRRGIKVKQGQVIGYVGSTGLSTGPHLDFRFWKNGSPVNPRKVEAPPVEPVKKENLQTYDSVKKYWLNELKYLRAVLDSSKKDTVFD